MSTPIHVNDADFEAKVLKSSLPVIVDFWAPWCGPCKMVAPVLEELAKENDGKVVVAKVNTDENVRYAQTYGVQGIPTILFIKDGKEVDRQVGAVPKSYLSQKLSRLLA
jgi:thioredoxin 1